MVSCLGKAGPLFYGMVDAKEQQPQERKITKTCSLVTRRGGRKTGVLWPSCRRSGGRNSPRLCLQEKVLLVCPNPYSCATPLVTDGIDVAAARDAWLATPLLTTEGSQTTRRSELSQAGVSNKSRL